MVFYVEACEAGSMFMDLPDDMNIYTMTASDEEVSSWAIHCDEDAIIEGKDLGTCLGDLFSVNWMADTIAHRGRKHSLYEQFVQTKGDTEENADLERKGSPVCVYGDMELQERAMIHEFMSGPLAAENYANLDQANESEEGGSDFTNQILNYLLGFSPKIDIEDDVEDGA